MSKTLIAIDPEDRDAILAALRFFQGRKGALSHDLYDIFTNGGEHAGLDNGAIDHLCESINMPDKTPHEKLIEQLARMSIPGDANAPVTQESDAVALYRLIGMAREIVGGHQAKPTANQEPTKLADGHSLFRVHATLFVSKIVAAEDEDDAEDVFMDDIPYPDCATNPEDTSEGTVACDLRRITSVEKMERA